MEDGLVDTDEEESIADDPDIVLVQQNGDAPHPFVRMAGRLRGHLSAEQKTMLIDGLWSESRRDRTKGAFGLISIDCKELAKTGCGEEHATAELPALADSVDGCVPFEELWKKATGELAYGIEVLIMLSKQHDYDGHRKLCREAMSIHHPTLSEQQFALYAFLMMADDLILTKNDKGPSGCYYWSGNAWIVCSNNSIGNAIRADLQIATVEFARYVTGSLKQRLEASASNPVASKRLLVAARAQETSIGSARVTREIYTILMDNMSARALEDCASPFDKKYDLVPFSDCAFNLKTRTVGPIHKQDYVLLTTGKPWKSPTAAQMKAVRAMFKAIMPDDDDRKTLYSILRLAVTGRRTERFFILFGRGRNGKTLAIDHVANLLGSGLSAPQLPVSIITQDIGSDTPCPGARKMHKVRLKACSDALGYSKTKDGKSEVGCPILSDSVKKVTGESQLSLRSCFSNDTECKLLGIGLIMGCNHFPPVMGDIDIAFIQRVLVLEHTQTFTEDPKLLAEDPTHYKKLDKTFKSLEFMEEHRCALLQVNCAATHARARARPQTPEVHMRARAPPDARARAETPEAHTRARPDARGARARHCALLQVICEECKDGELFTSANCQKITNSYIEAQRALKVVKPIDAVDAFLTRCCWKVSHTAQPREFLDTKALLAAFNHAGGLDGTPMIKLGAMAAALQSNPRTQDDYHSQGKVVLHKAAGSRTLRNQCTGLVDWQLRAAVAVAEPTAAAASAPAAAVTEQPPDRGDGDGLPPAKRSRED